MLFRKCESEIGDAECKDIIELDLALAFTPWPSLPVGHSMQSWILVLLSCSIFLLRNPEQSQQDSSFNTLQIWEATGVTLFDWKTSLKKRLLLPLLRKRSFQATELKYLPAVLTLLLKAYFLLPSLLLQLYLSLPLQVPLCCLVLILQNVDKKKSKDTLQLKIICSDGIHAVFLTALRKQLSLLFSLSVFFFLLDL